MNNMILRRVIVLGYFLASWFEVIGQDEEVSGNLSVDGNLVVKGQSVNRKTLHLGGDLDIFYPVFFSDPSWSYGSFDLQIYRAHVHWNGSWHGSMMAHFKSHSTNWGHGSAFVDASIYESKADFIADYRASYYPAGMVVWLKGGTRYDYHASGAEPVVMQNSSGDGTIKLSTNSSIDFDEFSVKTTVSSLILKNGRTFSNNVFVEKKLGVGVSNPQYEFELRGDSLFVGENGALLNLRNGSTGVTWQIDSSLDDGLSFGNSTDGLVGGASPLFLSRDGNVGIGKADPERLLDVAGTIRAEEIIVEVGTADYVFEEGYRLKSLNEIESHIEEHGHLPGIPSAAQVDSEGLSLGDSHRLLLEKVEELTLHLIEKEKQIMALQESIREIEHKIK